MATPQYRYYEEKYPDVDQLVMVKVKSITEMGAYVSLLEYGGIEGMILLSELSRRRIRSISKLIRVGRNEAVLVLRVDKDKGYIDLSKRRVSREDIIKLEAKYERSKKVHSILSHVVETTHGHTLEELYECIAWPLAKKYGHAFDAFRLCITDPETVLTGMTIPSDAREVLLKNIQMRMTPQPVKLRADIEVACFAYEGINAVRKALRAGAALTDDSEHTIKIKLVAPPLYVLLLLGTLDKDAGKQLLNDAIDAIRTTIEAAGGKLTVKAEPRSMSDRDDKELSSMLEKLELDNMEVSGDDDADSDDE